MAALLWLLLEDSTPVVICGDALPKRRQAVLDALLDLPTPDTGARRPFTAVLPGAWSPQLSARLLALKPGDRFAAVVGAGSLLDLMAEATSEAGGLTEDEVRAMGLVIVVGADGRVEAAHLMRPVERDGAGHLQRRPPAVLASRDPRTGTLEHFAWGVMPELADRVDRSQADLERRQSSRARFLLAQAATVVEDPEEVGRRLHAHLRAEPPRERAPERPAARPSNAHPPHA